MNNNDSTISVLNDLIEINRDGETGYKSAAEDSKAGELAPFFRRLGSQRTENIRELQARVTSLGGAPAKSGTVSASLHRGWMDIKTALTSNEAHAVLSECERGEDVAVNAYRDAMGKNLESVSRDLISRQAKTIQAAHNSVKEKRDSVAYAKK